MFVVSLMRFMKFGGQSSRNVHDVQKVFLATTLCIFACFVKFTVLVLYEIYIGVPNIVNKPIRV